MNFWVAGFTQAEHLTRSEKQTLQCPMPQNNGGIGHFQSIKTGVLLIFSFITGDKTEFLSPMMFSNEYITGI